MAKNQTAPTAETPAESAPEDLQARVVALESELSSGAITIAALRSEADDAKGGLEAAGKEIERLQGELRSSASALEEAGYALVKLRDELDAERARGLDLSRFLEGKIAALEASAPPSTVDAISDDATSNTGTPHIDNLPEDHPLKR